MITNIMSLRPLLWYFSGRFPVTAGDGKARDRNRIGAKLKLRLTPEDRSNSSKPDKHKVCKTVARFFEEFDSGPPPQSTSSRKKKQ